MGAFLLVCDVSGSMIESGKRLTVRNLLRQVEQFQRFGLVEFEELCVVAWSDGVAIVEWDFDEEVPELLLDCAGSARGEALVHHFSNSQCDRILIFTDGHWTEECRRSVAQLHDDRGDNVRIVKVGSDADPNLSGPHVFAADEMFWALDAWVRA